MRQQAYFVGWQRVLPSGRWLPGPTCKTEEECFEFMAKIPLADGKLLESLVLPWGESPKLGQRYPQ